MGGLAGQTTLAGDLILDHQNLVLDDLSPLATLTQVAGNLEVSLPMLTQVQGLSALEEVSGDLRLFDMDLLANLDGLQAMQVIGVTLDLHGHGSMVNIEALAGLDEIGTVDISQNQALRVLRGGQLGTERCGAIHRYPRGQSFQLHGVHHRCRRL